jgi:tRNA pseudouridine38-40 synthase
MLKLCYDGTRYKGWQKQGNTAGTIQEKLETILSRLLDQPVELAASGRTDAGVHAREQVCSFRADTVLSTEELLRRLRAHLPEDIGALSLEIAPPRFHARLSCVGKTYVYRIWNSRDPDVFERKYRTCVPESLDLDAMRRAAELLCGEHDFAAFCSAKPGKKSTVRELRSIQIEKDGADLRLIYAGSGFLYNMVRILTGTLLEVGKGLRQPEEMSRILASRDRRMAGPTAPAQGLFLWQVDY